MSRLWISAAAIAAGVLSASPAPAPAQPPPPPPPDPMLAEPIDGYDVQTLYALWHFHVERQKSEAIRQRLVSDDDQPGLRIHSTIASFERSGELGMFAAGRFEAHCRFGENYRSQPGSCVTVFRKATIRAGYESARDDGFLSRWSRAAFDPQALVRHLRALGLPPETDWWRQDRDRMFSVLPSPVPVLVERGVVDVLTGEQCPAMAETLARIDGAPVPIVADLPGIGGDNGDTWLAPPHGVVASDRIVLRGEDSTTTIEQSGATSLLRPALIAAEACLRARAAD